MADRQREHARVLDLWWAFLAGDRVWIDGDERPAPKVRMAAALEIFGLAVVVTQLWSPLTDRIHHVDGLALFVLASASGTVAAGVLAVRPVVVMQGRRTTPVPFMPRVLWRGLCFLVLVVVVAFLRPGWAALAAWPLGIVVGADVVSTAWTLGIAVQPRRWYRRFLVSPLHVGVIGGISAMLLFGADGASRWQPVGLYAAMHLGILGAGITIVALDTARVIIVRTREREREAFVQKERRHLAHWLHDDVLSEVRLAALRVQHGGTTPEQIAHELRELDHRLRLRQLDEVLQTREVRLAEILQPHVRRAQSLGLDISDVPSLDTMGRRVDSATGRLFRRAVSVLTSNALNAGATRLGFRVDVNGDAIVLEVTDDAGGFDFHDVPAGRGLDQLRADVGPDGVVRIPEVGGSTMRVTIPIHGTPAPPTTSRSEAAPGRAVTPAAASSPTATAPTHDTADPGRTR